MTAETSPEAPPFSELPRPRLLGVHYHVVDRADLFDAIATAVARPLPSTILNVNTRAMNIAQYDTEYRDLLNRADLVFVDGAGVQLGAKLVGKPVGERLTPMDWIDEFFERCSEQQWPIFFLGDTEAMRERFAAKIIEKHPNCPLVDSHHGFFDQQGEENDALIERINRSGATMLLVGMGMPVQEKWLWANRDKLTIPVRFSIGALNRVYTGDIARGPAWMTNNGMEWLYRLCVQPGQTWRRYILGNPLFIGRVLARRLTFRSSD